LPEGCAGNRAYGTTQLRQDLNRFAFLPGGDGEALYRSPLYSPAPQ
jgi:hypothetical protein